MQNGNFNKEEIITLVIKAKKGDKKAFSVIYSEFFTPIFRYIYFRVNSKEEAEDLAQNVFLKIWLALPNFETREGGQFISWCFTIARNLIIDFWKKKKEISLENDETFKISERKISETEDNLIQSIEIKNIGAQIKKAVTLLGDDQQEVIVLKFINDLSNKEIADLLGKNEEAVRQIQSRALKELRRLLQNTN